MLSKHAFHYSSGQQRRKPKERWAMNMPDMSIARDESYWVGPDIINKAYAVHRIPKK